MQHSHTSLYNLRALQEKTEAARQSEAADHSGKAVLALSVMERARGQKKEPIVEANKAPAAVIPYIWG